MRPSELRSCVLTLVILLTAGGAAAQGYFPQSVASGDPRADSVILWTRVVDAAAPVDGPLPVQLQVARDEGFTDVVVQRDLFASPAHDGVVKVRIDGLEADAYFWYRFHYAADGLVHTSRVGRTRTAPAAGSDRPVRFAVAYCQDYPGRYYNAYTKLLADHDQDLDFVLFLGDYIYETTAPDDPDDRRVTFADSEGAIPLGGGVQAAASLANYRTLYRTYRSDPMLQAVHERWPMVAIWDDHEFSNDAWGATGTYFDGRVDETSPERKRHAEQAYFEYLPIDAGLGADGELEITAEDLYPNTRIYRDLRFGQHLHLLLTDYRTFLPDHLIPEDAFPGAVALDESTLRSVVGDAFFEEQLQPVLDPYLNVNLPGLSLLRQTMNLIVGQMLVMANPQLDFRTAVAAAQEVVQGPLSTTFINAAFAAAGLPAPINDAVRAVLPRGVTYLYLGKQAPFSRIGSRNLVQHDLFNLLAGVYAAQTGGARQNVFGSAQMAWLGQALATSATTWRVLASSVPMTPMVLDVTNPQLAAMLPPDFPAEYRTRFTLTVDQWDGYPNMRAALLEMLGAAPAVVISGDVHASFVTDHGTAAEFIPPAISSTTFGQFVIANALSVPALAAVDGLVELLMNLDPMLQISAADPTGVVAPWADILHSNNFAHGFGIAEVGATAVDFTVLEIPNEHVSMNHYDEPGVLDDLFEALDFRYTVDGQLTAQQ